MRGWRRHLLYRKESVRTTWAAWELFPLVQVEPISLNATRQVRDRLARERVSVVTVVAPALRSRRSSLVYRAVLGRAGAEVRCVPVLGRTTPDRWPDTWHGIQEVVGEFLKLQYYRFYVLPVLSGRATSPAAGPLAS